MENQKTIKLYVYVDGINDIPFYGSDSSEYEEFILSNGEQFILSNGFIFNVRNVNEQIEIGSFRYDAKRMGGAPTISFTLMYEDCLDNFWSDQVYAKFRGERYFLKQTPTSSKSNDDARYRHDVELIAERTILDNAYFYDAVVGSPIENDVPVTNSTKFHFYGHIEKFVERMNASLQYTGIQKVDEDGNVVSGYHVVLDDDVVTRDQKQVSFDSAVFSQALQESYNTFGIPFYFDGQTIHIGFTNNVIGDVLEYGVDGALISATKTNANFKVINRATGNGSSDNIPYYYPNNAPKGELAADVVSASEDYSCIIVDDELFSEKINIDSSITYKYSNVTIPKVTDIYKKEYRNGVQDHHVAMSWRGTIIPFDIHIESPEETTTTLLIRPLFEIYKYQGVVGGTEGELASCKIDISLTIGGKVYIGKDVGILGYEFDAKIPKGSYSVRAKLTVNPNYTSTRENFSFDYGFEWNADTKAGWYYDDKEIELEDVGLSISEDATLTGGDTITQRLVKKVNTSSTLQPSIYRATDGKERFYNAVNYPFPHEEGYELKYGEYVLDGEVHNDAYKKDDGTYYEFTNEYKEGRPREHVFTVDDIKPTIKEATNNISWVEKDEEGNDKTVFQRIDMFSDFAYNIGDNDETYTDPNGNTSFKHPYFFAKLRKLDFNLFEHASEMGEMTFSMTSGHCGACNFKIGVSDDYPQFNTVQVDEDGNLVYDENGYVLCGLEDFQGKVEPQDRQQDTVNYEVWIALKKEEDTYGILMPKAPKYEGGTLVDAGHRPVACSSENANDGDTFVILNINLPDEYVYRAEKKLEKAIVKYIWENNVEKFNFSVNFSRIFLEENYLLKGDESVLSLLNENARLARVKYNGDEYILYVSSYSYSMNDDDVLPEIRVELDDTLTIAQNALQTAIDGVKSDIASAINTIDVAAIGSRYFLRKDTYDVAEEPIEFKKGVVFGDNGMVEVNEDGTSKLTIDYLDVTRKATFTSLEIQEKSHVGGEILITPASMVCNRVEELEDAYRCYFETYGESGEEIFNQFAEGDQAISQTFNEWGGHYYWRLVTGIGEDYIDLSKTDCAPESDVPKVGDKIIQLGNRTNTTRQAAQVLSSHGENAPSFIMYNGIDSFSLEGKNITGIVWNPEKQEPQMYSYGDFFFGDRNLENNFITFQKKEGDEEKKLHINADVTIGANSSGLENLSEWSVKQQEIDNAGQKAQDAIDATNVVSASVTNLSTTVSTLETNVNKSIQEINQKLDGVVESYFDDYTPSRTNEPAATWITDGTEADHVGDTFTNTAIQGEDAGKSWRWLEQSDGTYDWQQIADSDAAKALALAGQAKATADGKTTTFLVTPSNYSVGDIWIVGDVVPDGFVFKRGDILTTSNSSTEYVANHWSKYLNYMDEFETELNETVGELENSIAEAEDAAKQYSDEGKEVLQGLINDLEKSKAEVNDVYTKAQSDGIISQSEQQAINASKAYADAQKELLDTTLKAYADGVADNAEKEAIADAEAKVNAAKKELNDAIDEVDGKVEGAIQSMNDKEELFSTFDKGSNLDVDGVVMSKMVAVKNEDEEIEAFLNGSTFAEDDSERNCGKLILAAGIPEEGGVLEERAKQANTRIYEDGCIYTNNMHLQKGATIGETIRVQEDGFELDGPNDGVITITEQYGFQSSNDKMYFQAGGTCQGNVMLEVGVNGAGYCPSTPVPLMIFGDKGGIAMECGGGMFAGFRPKTRIVTKTYDNIWDSDHTIIVNVENATVVFDLPERPQYGQVYEIYICHASAGVLLYTRGKGGYDFIGGSQFADIQINAGSRRHITLMFAGQWWLNYRNLY